MALARTNFLLLPVAPVAALLPTCGSTESQRVDHARLTDQRGERSRRSLT